MTQIQTESDFDALSKSIDYKKFMHVRAYPSKRDEVKLFKEKFSQLQENAPFQVSEFSDELKKSGSVLCDVVQYFPSQIKSFSPELLNDYRWEMVDFFEWWFGKIIYSLELNKSHKDALNISKFYFEITDNDLWFYKNMLYLGMLEFTSLPKKIQTKEFVLSLLENEAMRNKIENEKITFPPEFLSEHGIAVEIFTIAKSRPDEFKESFISENKKENSTIINDRLNPEIAKVLFQKIKDGEIANLYELTKDLVIKQKGLTIQEAQWKEHSVSDEAWCIVSETLDCNYNPDILPYSAFIMKNADKLFNEMEQTVLGEHFKSIVPNQTPEQFREFLSESTINDKALAYIVDDGETEFFRNLTKFNSNEWTDMQESYIDYLQKNIVYMEHLKDKSVIEPSCIHYMLHEIEKNVDQEIPFALFYLLKEYFQKIGHWNLFDETKWSVENKELLVRLKILQAKKTYSIIE